MDSPPCTVTLSECFIPPFLAAFIIEDYLRKIQPTMYDLYMIDRRLRMLQLVAHHGTVTGAAEELHYTPSGVSHQLKLLAEELRVPLLEQRGRGIRLTAAAHTLLSHAEVLFAATERAYAALDELAEHAGRTYTICGFSTAATHLLPATAAGLKEQFPQLEVKIIEAEPGRCFDLLLAGETDLALVTATSKTPSSTDRRFRQQWLLDDPLDLLVPQNHPLAQRRSVRLRDAAEEQWIVGAPATAYHQLVTSACLSAGFTPDIAHVADEWDTGAALVAHGFGIILVPRLARPEVTWPIVRVPLSGDSAPVRPIHAVTRRAAEDSPLATASLALVEHRAAELMVENDPGSADW